jgi:hypothetical protein
LLPLSPTSEVKLFTKFSSKNILEFIRVVANCAAGRKWPETCFTVVLGSGESPRMARMNTKNKEELSLDSAARHILEECRMVLPGIQALFGFQC